MLTINSAIDCHDCLLQTESVAFDASATNEYFSVTWFSDWEGYGCVALKDIDKHTLIHVEKPFLKGRQIDQAIDLHNSGDLESHLDDKEYLKNTCGKSKKDIDNLWQLHDQYSSSSKRLWGIISSNSFSNQDKDYAKRLYLTTSRFNHSCSPNCGYDFDDWNIRIYSLRKIKAGETLCISYSDVIYFFPRDVRRSYLIGAMRFECACTRCDVATDSAVSDENRKRLKKIAAELKHRVNSTLYNAEFCMQVGEVAKRMSSKDVHIELKILPSTSSTKQQQRQLELLREKVRLRKLSKTIPTGQHDIDLIVEYINIAEREKVDFDMLPVYRLAYDVALEAGTSVPPKEYWAQRYLELITCAKGPDHPETLRFVKEISVGL
ncbi:hypothetical protein ACHAXR_007733 [Thalassiosira sp. AJA248-18]